MVSTGLPVAIVPKSSAAALVYDSGVPVILDLAETGYSGPFPVEEQSMHLPLMPTRNARGLRLPALGLSAALALATFSLLPATAAADTVTCPPEGEVPQQGIRIGSTGDSQPDLLVNGACTISTLGDYYFGQVNIVKDGILTFVEPPQASDPKKNKTNFWASSIIIENGGALVAGVGDQKPYGTNGNELNIILYGHDRSEGDPVGKPGQGAGCKQEHCGIPAAHWQHETAEPVKLPGFTGDQKDYFYAYHGMPYDDKPLPNGEPGYFGYKTLGLSYGGRLELRGHKGTLGAAEADKDPTNSGSSWTRLAKDLKQGDTELHLAEPFAGGWGVGDRIVVTATDYLPDHSEEFTIKAIDGAKLTLDRPAKWFHNGTKFPLADRLKKAGSGFQKAVGLNDPATAAHYETTSAAETRAAVALLTRSIRIVSGGDVAGQRFDWETPEEKAQARKDHPDVPDNHPKVAAAADLDPHYAFGAHTVFRQGFEKLQIQGVEFRWMGQGGRIGHYPVHFHMARQVPDDTYIKDSSVNESMTRWYVLHATQHTLLQRNVGYKSIGHGYYLEDATETDNKLYANLGVFARAAVVGPANPRNVPGILARVERGDVGGEAAARIKSDILYPTVFWFTNGWNDFVGNMAAGANTCGGCYWQVPATANGAMRGMKWSGYAGLQFREPGTSPLKTFYKNYCSTAMFAFNHVGSTSDCKGIGFLDPAGNPIGNPGYIYPVKGIAPEPGPDGPPDKIRNSYYPATTSYGIPTRCDPTSPGDQSCRTVNKCNYSDPKDCTPTVLDSMTTSFNWAETNFGAIWLRAGWNLADRLFMSDIQNGGIGLITGGDYTRANLPVGFWSLLSNSVFVGRTQPHNSYATEAGPLDEQGKTLCDSQTRNDHCIVKSSSVSYPRSNWSTNRMVNIYDGPFYQEGNAYLDIHVSDCNSLEECMYFGTPGVRRQASATPSGPKVDKGYLPNAAIGWKQPNGFYYPPAFHSRNLFFENVDIRHYLTVPLFKPGTYQTDMELTDREFVFPNFGSVPPNIFGNFTDVDRQTVLNDMDGTLTGFKNTISVNQDPFFSAPVQTAECLSAKEVLPDSACAPKKPRFTPTARTSPYDHVTTVVYPGCAVEDGSITACGSHDGPDQTQGKPGRITATAGRGGTWSKDCTGPFCTGVRLYRQYLTSDASANNQREWQKWSAEGCSQPDKMGTEACDWPFIRLAGISMWQRSALTANHGTYYLDTTRSRESQRKTEALGKPGVPQQVYVECEYQTQTETANKEDLLCQPRSVNLFEGGQSYYVFQVFAQQDTSQTYQIYVGDGFDMQNGVKGIRVPLDSQHLKPIEVEFPKESLNWQMIEGPDGNRNVLEVKFDFSKLPKSIKFDPRDPANELCKPASFCEGDGGSCKCKLTPENSPLLRFNPKLKQTCDNVCSTWALEDVDCPDGGCVGFRFTLPGGGGFVADDKNHRPLPKPFPTTEEGSPWKTVGFSAADKSEAGICYYSAAQTPGLTGSCHASD